MGGSARTFDLVEGQQLGRPIPRLCMLILAEALLDKADAVRLQAVDGERGGVEFQKGGRWEMKMQVPTDAWRLLLDHLKGMAGATGPGAGGEMHVQFNDKHRVLALHEEVGPPAVITVVGFREGTGEHGHEGA